MFRVGVADVVPKSIAHHIHPRIIGEFDDSALMKTFGQAGAGIFIAPTAIAAEVEKQYGWLLSEQRMRFANNSMPFLWSARYTIRLWPRLQRRRGSGLIRVPHSHPGEK